MYALVKDNTVLAVGHSQEELAPDLELHGGKLLPVQPLELPVDHIIDGPVEYVVEDGKVRRTAKTVYAYANYAEARKLHYPPVAQYLDAVVKGDQAQIDAYIQACLAVKARFPKPVSQ